MALSCFSPFGLLCPSFRSSPSVPNLFGEGNPSLQSSLAESHEVFLSCRDLRRTISTRARTTTTAHRSVDACHQVFLRCESPVCLQSSTHAPPGCSLRSYSPLRHLLSLSPTTHRRSFVLRFRILPLSAHPSLSPWLSFLPPSPHTVLTICSVSADRRFLPPPLPQTQPPSPLPNLCAHNPTYTHTDTRAREIFPSSKEQESARRRRSL